MKGKEQGAKDQVIVVRDRDGELHHGIFYEKNSDGIAALVHAAGRLSFRAFAAEEVVDVEVVDGYQGRQGLLEVMMRRRAVTREVDLVQFGIVDDVLRRRIIYQSVEFGCSWTLGVSAACSLVESGVVDDLLSHTALPTWVRAACLPRAEDTMLVNLLITHAHSSAWETHAKGEGARQAYRDHQRLGTAAAYVFAKSEGIPVDDPAGLRFIRTEAVVADLVATGKMPWVKERLAAMNGGKGALGI